MSNKASEREHKPFFKQGEEVFFTAFIKPRETAFFICRGQLEKCPDQKERQIFKVKVLAIASKAVGSKEEESSQSLLLGRTITKKFKELHKQIPFFMEPSKWLEAK